MDLNSIKLVEVTLMFFRARVLTANSRRTVSRGDSWRGWFVTNTPSDVSETDVETLAKELGNFGPIQLLELYRQVVLTTSGVPNAIVRTSICHALVSPQNSASLSTFRSSMERIFDYFLKIEEVEDGELTSDSEEEAETGTIKLFLNSWNDLKKRSLFNYLIYFGFLMVNSAFAHRYCVSTNYA